MKTAKRLSTENRAEVAQISDPKVIAMLERRAELEAYAKEFARLDRAAKDLLKAHGATLLLVGQYKVTITERELRQYDYPQEVQDQYFTGLKVSKVVNIALKD